MRAPIGRGKSKRYASHVKSAVSEEALAKKIHELPDEVVLRWGKKVTMNGADIISYNLKTKRISLWDDKFRSKPTRIKASSTFEKRSSSLAKAIAEAKAAIKESGLSEADKAAALDSLKDRTFQLRTHGSGKARNSTFRTANEF